MTESLAEALPREQARVREIVAEYDKIPGGKLAATMMRVTLVKAEIAASSGDVVEMLSAYKALQEWKL